MWSEKLLRAVTEAICCHGNGHERKRGLINGKCCAEWQVKRAEAILEALKKEGIIKEN